MSSSALTAIEFPNLVWMWLTKEIIFVADPQSALQPNLPKAGNSYGAEQTPSPHGASVQIGSTTLSLSHS